MENKENIKITKMNGKDIDIHFSDLFKTIIKAKTIIMDLGFGQCPIKYYSEDGFALTYLTLLFMRQYEHEMAAYDRVLDVPKYAGVIDSKDMEGLWARFDNDDKKSDYCDRILGGFIYNPNTNYVTHKYS